MYLSYLLQKISSKGLDSGLVFPVLACKAAFTTSTPARWLWILNTDLSKIGWPSQQSGNKKIAERSKGVYVQSTQCNLGVTYPSHSVQICRSNKTVLNRQRTSSCRTLHCPSCPMMDSPRLTTLQADRDSRPIVTNQPGRYRDRS
jgi:hypothetical protein